MSVIALILSLLFATYNSAPVNGEQTTTTTTKGGGTKSGENPDYIIIVDMDAP